MPKQAAQTFIPLTDPALTVFVPTTQTIAQSPLAAATVNITQIDQRTTQTYKINNPGGAPNQVQVNVDGKFVGDSGMTYNVATDSLTIAGSVAAGSLFTDTLNYANGTTWSFPGTFTTADVASYLPTYSGSVAALTVDGQTTLGAVANVHISGGTTAQVLSTDGAGNLSWAPGPGAIASVSNVWTAGQSGPHLPLTSSNNSVAVNLANSSRFTHTLTENTTIAAPTTPLDGQTVDIEFIQDAVTARLLTFDPFYKFVGGAPTISTSLGSRSRLVGTIRSTLDGADVSLQGPFV